MRLNLQHTWTTTMSSSQYRDTLHTAFTRGGITGHGEGAPIVRYHEDAASAHKAVESVRDLLLSADPMQFSKIMAEVFKRVPGRVGGQGRDRYRADGLGGQEAGHSALLAISDSTPRTRRSPRFPSASIRRRSRSRRRWKPPIIRCSK